MAMKPIQSNPGRNNTWGFVRRSKRDGFCGYKGIYPCTHWGVDLPASRGTVARAPESGVIAAVSDGKSAPWRGYGPGVLVIQGHSGFYHLLSHLESDVVKRWSKGLPVREGAPVGKVSSAKEVHWEVRKDLTGPGESNTIDPLAWLATQPLPVESFTVFDQIVRLFRSA